MKRRLPVLVIYSYQLGMFKRYHFSMEGIFYQKWYTYQDKRVRGWTSGQSLPVYFIEYPPVKQSSYDFSDP